MGGNKKIAVLIPCYNEEATIEKVIRDFKKSIPEADIYVYDNNSKDRSVELARESGAIVCHEYRQGKGNVIRTMFRDIDADCYIMVDGDDTYPAEHAREMAEMVIKKKVDMVIGDRLSSTYFSENKRKFHNAGNTLVRWLINKTFNGNIKDIMTGFRAFSPLFVKTFPILSKGFEIETEMTIHAMDNNYLIESMPVKYRDRPEDSESKLNTFSDGFKVLKTIGKLFMAYRPFAFFTTVAVVLWIVALVFFIPVLVDFVQTGEVLKIPTLIVTGVVATIGVLLWICGIILNVVIIKNREQFEL